MGTKKAIAIAINTEEVQKRHTGLMRKIKAFKALDKNFCPAPNLSDPQALLDRDEASLSLFPIQPQ